MKGPGSGWGQGVRGEQIGLAEVEVDPPSAAPCRGNAVAALVAGEPHQGLPRLLRAIGDGDLARAATGSQRRALLDRFELDLVGLLNLAARADLEGMAEALGLAPGGSIGELRARLWQAGAEIEAAGREVGPALQPIPVLLRLAPFRPL